MATADIHTLTGAYAADALSPEERAAFQRHLHECPSCTQEVRELQETVGRLGAGAAVGVPDRLREKVLADVARSRQVAPSAALAEPWRRQAWGRRGLLAAAACLVLVFGAISAGLYSELQDSRRLNDQVIAVLTAPDARTETASSGAELRGTVVVSRQRGELVFVPVGLADVPKDRTYQLWLLGPGDPRPAGLLRTDADQDSRLVAGVTRQDDALGMTVEPAGGSRRPTTQPVLVVPLPRSPGV